MVNLELIGALNDLQKEKGIDKNVVLAALEDALSSAYKKSFGKDREIVVKVNPESGEIQIFHARIVVADVDYTADINQIKFSEAIKINKKIKLGEEIREEMIPDKNDSRIAAQTAKQVIVQKIKEAEKEMIFNEYKSHENTIVVGVVRRFESRNVILAINDRVEVLLPLKEQLPRERFRISDKIKAYIINVEKSGKGPNIIVSRTCPEFLKRLFEMEIPEIMDSLVEIKSVSREPGIRSKVAVVSHKEKVDPVGACVGYRGSRIQGIISELKGEKIDIVKWNDDLDTYLSNALNPVKLVSMRIKSETDGVKHLEAIVPDSQLSLAIGKEGQNVKLISRLLKIKLDIINESEYKKFIEKNMFGNDTPAKTEEN
ncbi:MAG: transcription termination factor NusA [Candidatus Wallbacteria bacterium]|nr:transcription termination factor NusA [Candidatus Wallbacteria bacterium]